MPVHRKESPRTLCMVDISGRGDCPAEPKAAETSMIVRNIYRRIFGSFGSAVNRKGGYIFVFLRS